MPEKIKLYSLSSGEFRFDLIAENRAVIGSSELFATKEQALSALDLVRHHSNQDRLFSIYCDYDDKFYFNLQTEDGNIILSSQGYSSSQAAEEGIKVLKKIATSANLIEKIQ